jgi:uncharacterized protein involved in response to NO
MDERRVHEAFFFAAQGIGLTAGFGYAAIIVAALAFKWPLGTWWVALVQAHGHAQLFGWTGLFVLGVGLFFLPRLRGTTLALPRLAQWALASLVSGIALRAMSQPLLALSQASMPQNSLYDALGRSGLMLSGALELVGAGLILTMFAASFRRARPMMPSAPIIPVLPYLAVAVISLSLAILLNAALSTATALRGEVIFPSALDDALTHLMIYGFVLPIALALSVRNLPLFMRLAFPPNQVLFPILISYVAGMALRLAMLLEQLFGTGPSPASRLDGLGAILESSALLVFIWQLDVLLRRKTSWLVSRTPPPSGYIETRRPTRKNYPDYGEFGHFEWLIFSAYVWLAFAGTVALLNGFAMLLGNLALLNPDIERHSIAVGFITLLIFGMAARMLPGFSGKNRVASTRLVLATFWLGNLAALARVLPLLAPGFPGGDAALGSSGAIGWLAVVCLAVNLGRTLGHKSSSQLTE